MATCVMTVRDDRIRDVDIMTDCTASDDHTSDASVMSDEHISDDQISDVWWPHQGWPDQ